jgi:hypothetical protein
MMMRNVGLAIGFALLAIGLWEGVTGGPARTDTAQLAQRKDKLFADLVEVEAQHRSGRLDQRRYASKRQTLMTQLEQVMNELDRTPGGGLAA